MSDTVLVDIVGGVTTITLNRPDAMNSLDVATKEALLDAVRSVADDPAARCVVLTGTGRAFCVGQDLKQVAVPVGAVAAGVAVPLVARRIEVGRGDAMDHRPVAQHRQVEGAAVEADQARLDALEAQLAGLTARSVKCCARA